MKSFVAWFLALIVVVVLMFVVTAPSHAQEAGQEYVRVTFYVEPGRMADGAMVHRDAAACSSWLPFGTQLMFPDGYVVTCEDRGHGDRYWHSWVDVWSPSYAWGRENVNAAYGDYTWVQIIRWGWED